MDTPKIHESEYRLCLIMWEKEPIRSPELVRLCKERLGWKETTAYTVMKRLEERGVLKVENKIFINNTFILWERRALPKKTYLLLLLPM